LTLRPALATLRQAAADFMSDDAITLAAALSFYSALSLAPLLVLLIWIASLLGGAAQEELVQQMVALVGPEGGAAIQDVVESAQKTPTRGSIAGAVGLAALLFSAAGVFAQLQHSLNVVFDVERVKARGGSARSAWAWARRRLLSMGMVLAVGFLLLVSLAVSAALAALLANAQQSLPATEAAWRVIDFAAPLAIFVVLFAALFKFLPDVRIGWRDVWLASAITAGLFSLGKVGIGLYLGHSSIGSAYGAAGSLVVLLVWVYYATTIFLFGAEVSQAWARAHGRGFEAKEGARLIEAPRPPG
jgi:membrane protein